jgi:hypothetical protein
MSFRLLAHLARSLQAGWSASRVVPARRRKVLRSAGFLPARIESLETRCLPSVIIPVTSHRDLVYDDTRDLLYVTTSEGRLERWDPNTQQLLTSYAFGTLQNGADITKNGQFLYVSEVQSPFNGYGVVHKLDLGRVEVTELPYTLLPPERGAWDINLNDRGVGLVSSQYELSSWGSLRSLDTAGMYAIKPAELGSGANGTVRNQTNIFRSPDRLLFVLLEPELGNGPVMTYDSVGGTFLKSRSLGVELSDSMAAINRNNTQIAIEVGSDVFVMDQVLTPLYSLPGIDGGILYDPTRDVLYGAVSSTDEIIAFSSATGRELYRLPVGSDVTLSTPYGNGEMDISDDGRWLFISVTAGVAMIDLEDPPALSINDVSIVEGDAGTNDLTFTVSLSRAALQTVTVDFATANGTATSGSDYDPATGSLSFSPGETAKTVTVKVRGDTLDEPNETLLVNLSNPDRALIRDGQGVGTIVDDDVGVTITSTAPNPVLTSTFTVRVQFGDPIDPSTFTPGDLTVTNGTVVSITMVSSSEFFVQIAAGADGPVTVLLGENKVTTAGGLGNRGSNVFSIVVDAVNELPTISPIDNQTTNEDVAVGPIAFTVGDVETPAKNLVVTATTSDASLVAVSNIVLDGGGANRTVTVTPEANRWGSVEITLTVTDARGGTANTSFAITVNSVADTPSVTGARTEFPQQTTDGLVIRRNPADGIEVTHFRITNVSGGTLYQNDGTTPIGSGTFLTAAQGQAGLKFTPAIDSAGPFSFQVQASQGPTVDSLGGNFATASIEVVGMPVRMYRAYNPIANFHFFTTSKAQFDNALANGYRDETTGRPGYSVLSSHVAGSVPLYRLYNLQRGFHYYTADPVERQILVNMVPVTSESFGRIGWRDEGIEGYVYTASQSSATPIYRLYNRDAGTHLFTESLESKSAILQQFPLSWREESRMGYAFLASAVGTPPGGGSQSPVARKAVRAAESSAPTATLPPTSITAPRSTFETIPPALGGLLVEMPAVLIRVREAWRGETRLPASERPATAAQSTATEQHARAVSKSSVATSRWVRETSQFFSAFDGRAWE